MKVSFVLVVDARGGVRVTKRLGRIDGDEVAISASIDVPAALFRRPVPRVDITLPAQLVDEIVLSADVSEFVQGERQGTQDLPQPA
jgi:hypothetical protein